MTLTGWILAGVLVVSLSLLCVSITAFFYMTCDDIRRSRK